MPHEPHAEEHIFRQGQLSATETPATETVIPEAFVRNVGKKGSSEVLSPCEKHLFRVTYCFFKLVLIISN